MAINITVGPGAFDFTVTIDKEGARRLIRIGLSKGSRNYGFKTRAAARLGRMALGHAVGVNWPVKIKLKGEDEKYSAFIERSLTEEQRREVAKYLYIAVRSGRLEGNGLLESNTFDKKTRKLIQDGKLGNWVNSIIAHIMSLPTWSSPYANYRRNSVS